MGAKKTDAKSAKAAKPVAGKPKKEGSVGKAKKKKWSKLNNLILFDKPTYDKLYKEGPSYKLITPSAVSERLKVRGSLAKQALRELHSKGLINLVSKHNSQLIYTRATKGDKDEKKVVEKSRFWLCDLHVSIGEHIMTTVKNKGRPGEITVLKV